MARSSCSRPREAGPHPRRHEPARRGAVARGRSRLRLRGPRHLRSLPGGRRRGAFAKHITSSADHLHLQRTRDALPRAQRPRRRSQARLPRARVCGDLVVDVPPESQLHRQVVRKEADAHPIEVDPVVRLYYVEVREPDLADPSGDLHRLATRSTVTGGSRARRRRPRARVAPAHAPSGDWTVTVAVHDGADRGVWPGFHDRALGIAFDVGSTTSPGTSATCTPARCWRARAQ